jgi:hypothetical protein
VNSKLTQALLVILAALLFATLVQGQRPSITGNPAPPYGRYQLISGPLVEVFDTETGKIYTWMPRDEKEKTEAYVFVKDSVNASVANVPIKRTR